MKQEQLKALFEIVERKGELETNGIHIIQNDTHEKSSFRIYTAKGHCFDVNKEEICDPDEVEHYIDVAQDGYTYSICYGWDGFINPINDTEAFKILTGLLKWV